MKKLLAILALLPLTAMGQQTNVKTSEKDANFPETKIHYIRAHNGLVPYYIGISGRHSETIYIIDGVSVQTIEPVTVEPTIVKIDINNPNTLKLERKDIMTLPYTDLTDMVSLSTSIHQQQRGAANHVGGSRQEDILYLIDGMQVARR